MDAVSFTQRYCQMSNDQEKLSYLVRELVFAIGSGPGPSSVYYVRTVHGGYEEMDDRRSSDTAKIRHLISTPDFQLIDAQEAYFLLQKSLEKGCFELQEKVIALPSFQKIPIANLEGLLKTCYAAEYDRGCCRFDGDNTLARYLLQSSRKEEFYTENCLSQILLSITGRIRPTYFYTSLELFQQFFLNVKLEIWKKVVPLVYAHDFARKMAECFPHALPANMPPDCAENLFVGLCREKDQVVLTGPTIALLTHMSVSQDGLVRCLTASIEHHADFNAVVAQGKQSRHFTGLSGDDIAMLLAKFLRTKFSQQGVQAYLDTVDLLFSHQNFKNASGNNLLQVLLSLGSLAGTTFQAVEAVFGRLLVYATAITALPQFSEIGDEQFSDPLVCRNQTKVFGLFRLNLFEVLSANVLRQLLFSAVREGWQGVYLTCFLDQPLITGEDLKAAIKDVPNGNRKPQADAIEAVKSHPKYTFQVGDCCAIL